MPWNFGNIGIVYIVLRIYYWHYWIYDAEDNAKSALLAYSHICAVQYLRTEQCAVFEYRMRKKIATNKRESEEKCEKGNKNGPRETIWISTSTIHSSTMLTYQYSNEKKKYKWNALFPFWRRSKRIKKAANLFMRRKIYHDVCDFIQKKFKLSLRYAYLELGILLLIFEYAPSDS